MISTVHFLGTEAVTVNPAAHIWSDEYQTSVRGVFSSHQKFFTSSHRMIDICIKY
jgi:hypothetical protein